MLKNKKLIIFDLDGVLIDSIPNMKYALKQTSNSFGFNLSFEKYRKYIGLPFEQIMKKMGLKSNIPLIKKKYIFFVPFFVSWFFFTLKIFKFIN